MVKEIFYFWSRLPGKEWPPALPKNRLDDGCCCAYFLLFSGCGADSGHRAFSFPGNHFTVGAESPGHNDIVHIRFPGGEQYAFDVGIIDHLVTLLTEIGGVKNGYFGGFTDVFKKSAYFGLAFEGAGKRNEGRIAVVAPNNISVKRSQNTRNVAGSEFVVTVDRSLNIGALSWGWKCDQRDAEDGENVFDFNKFW